MDCHPRESGDPGEFTNKTFLDSRFRGNDSERHVIIQLKKIHIRQLADMYFLFVFILYHCYA